MKIIREGDLSRITTVRRFECPDCGCVWEVGACEYRREVISGRRLCECCCPTCWRPVRIEDNADWVPDNTMTTEE